MQVFIGILLSCGALLGWLISILGLPGNWLIVLMALGCWAWAEAGSILEVGTTALSLIIGLALLGEALEFAAGALGANRVGGSKRSAVLAVIGSLIGAIGGFAIGSVIPIVGNLLISLAGSALGACIGSIIGERWVGRDWEHAMQVGGAAFWGRILGTIAKAFCGTAITIIFVLALWI